MYNGLVLIMNLIVTDASTIVIEKCKNDLLERIGTIANMNEIVSRQQVVLREY
jgi:glutamine synthetase type III